MQITGTGETQANRCYGRLLTAGDGGEGPAPKPQNTSIIFCAEATLCNIHTLHLMQVANSLSLEQALETGLISALSLPRPKGPKS